MAIEPSVAEIHSRRPPCLPLAHAHGGGEGGDEGMVDAVSGVVLDRQFRLLREDLVGPMREALHQLRR